ncbi:uncharacterized protein N7496_004260 [Penicillium cataractarum]|uniref:Uncharacterized protein n=1 Tax=Penicillium cataractarum TaxID=2100454 RepID=A0A9W9SNN9_9EURO|nr:uncharacterized protein N7496_004260 [Penicillium cataractarum]KAJ5381832.1 hypothetical protein N7496_004260 [Penicillium cataractarum]
MRFTGSSLLLALAAVTVVSGQKQYQKSTLQTNEKTLAVGLTPINRLMPRQGSAAASDLDTPNALTV